MTGQAAQPFGGLSRRVSSKFGEIDCQRPIEDVALMVAIGGKFRVLFFVPIALIRAPMLWHHHRIGKPWLTV